VRLRRTYAAVLWGDRRGDVHYNSRDFWRRNIPIDPNVARVMVAGIAYFDVGDVVEVGSSDLFAVAGLEGDALGLRPSER
jgi:hypothetical protein